MLQRLRGHDQGEAILRRARRWIGSIGLAIAVGVAYFLAAQLGLALLTAAERVAVFWPAAGISAGVLVALGKSARAPVAVAVIAASATAALLTDRSVWSAGAFGLCNAGEALLVAYLLERWFGPNFNLDSLRRVLGLFAAAAIATAISAVGASAAMKVFGPSTAGVFDVWEVWFASDVLGILTVAPLLIGIAASVRDAPPWREVLEGTAGVAILTVVYGLALALFAGPWALLTPAAFLFPLLLWLSSRCRPVFAAAALFAVSSAVVWTATSEWGRYGDASYPLAYRIIAAQVTMLGTTLSALALAALFAERRRHEATVAERDAQLELAGRTALVGSYVFDISTGRVQISAGYAAIYGLPEGVEEYTREEWQARVHPEDLARIGARRSEAFAERRREHRSEYRIIRPGGDIRWIESRAFLSYDGHGRAERMIGVNIDVTERKHAEEHQGVLIAELDHRVKNVLAGVAVVARRTSEHNSTVGDFIDTLDDRIQSMAATHGLLSQSRWQGVSLADLVRRELAPYAAGGNTVVEGPSVRLTAGATEAMAMVLHELTTNAAKYGSLSAPGGRVSVRWHLLSNRDTPSKLRLEWREVDGPVVDVPVRPGYGTSVIRDLIPYQLGGTVELEFGPNGVCCVIDVAVDSDAGCLAISRTNMSALRSVSDRATGHCMAARAPEE
jgi:PAS domain S-box-containing protein